MDRQTVRLLVFVVAVAAIVFRLWLVWRNRRWVIGERRGTTVVVRQKGPLRELVFVREGRELVQSRQGIGLAPSYVDGFEVGMLVEPQPKHLLFLGGGACVAPRQIEAKYPGVTIDIVENEPFVIAAANQHFGFRITKNVSMHATDARKFVFEATFAPYDLVVLDVYDAVGIPAGVSGLDFFKGVHAILSSDGAFVANLAHRPEVDEVAILEHIREAFPDLVVTRFYVGENTLVLAAKSIPTDVKTKLPFLSPDRST